MTGLAAPSSRPPAPTPAPVLVTAAGELAHPPPPRHVVPAPPARHRAVVRSSRSRRLVTHRVVTTTRPAPVADECGGPGWRQRRVDRALGALRADVLAPSDYAIAALPGRRGYLGLSDLGQRHIDIYVRSCAQESDGLLRHVVAHEQGHVFDALHMSASDRRAWMHARDIDPGAAWFGCSSCTDFATPAGDFAEVYAQWARGAGSNASRLAGPPSPAALAGLAAQFFHP